MGTGLVLGVRVAALSVLLLILAVPPGAADDGFYEQGGVEYYMAVGAHGSGVFESSAANSTASAFDGCAIVKVRPDKDLGRVQLVSLLDGVPVRLELARFGSMGTGTDGGIAQQARVDGARLDGSPQHPAVEAPVAGWGQAIMEVAGATYQDPATGLDNFTAAFFTTGQGFRDASGHILNPDGSPYEPGTRIGGGGDDREMHLRVRSSAPSSGEGHTDAVQVPGGDVPTIYEAPREDYRAVHSFRNVRFGANATLDIDGSGVPGFATDLQFRLRDPTGAVLHEATWQTGSGSLTGGVDDTFSFRLDRFGRYLVEVEGSSESPFQYQVTLAQEAAPPLALDFWWEEVLLGSYAPAAQDACLDEVTLGSEPVVGTVVERPPPPAWPVAAVVLTTLGIAAALLVAVKMAMMRRASRHPLETSARD